MSEQFTLKLNSPITEEQWDAITDVDFDHTEEIFFHTKHGKEVTFVKQKKGKWKAFSAITCACSECGQILADWIVSRSNFCPNCGADMRGGTDETD